MVFNATFNNYFSYLVAVICIGGGNQSTRGIPQTCSKSLTDKQFTHSVVSSIPRHERVIK